MVLGPNLALFIPQRADDIPQRQQPLVNIDAFHHTSPDGACALQSLRPSQVHKVELRSDHLIRVED